MNDQQNIRPKAIGVEEACKYIGVGRTTIFTLTKAKKLKPVKIGTRTVYLVAELDAFIDGLAEKAA